MARIAVLFGFVAAIAAGIAPAVLHQSAPQTVAINCPWWGCPVN
jgi:hypothetical protein